MRRLVMQDCNVLAAFIQKLWGSKEDPTPITVFCGAGISIQSGNLSTDDTRETILEMIFQNSSVDIDGDKKKIFQAIMQQTGQFEDFLMRIYDDLDDEDLRKEYMDALKEMYIESNPDEIHSFLADIANANLCPCIATTNYDQHLEGQMGKENLEIIFGDSLTSFDKKQTEKPFYLKLHGCAVNKAYSYESSSIKIFLPQVAGREVKKEVENALKYIFCDNTSSQKILFLGYSFSDMYDIVKWMNEKNNDENCSIMDNKEIFVVAHDESECILHSGDSYNNYVESLKADKKNAPTRSIPKFNNCTVFLGHTGRVVKESLEFLSIIPQLSKGKKSGKQFKEDNGAWLKSFFNELNNKNSQWKGYYAVLLRHQFLYEVARLCVFTGTLSKSYRESSEASKIVDKCYDFALEEISSIILMIEEITILNVDTKKYKKYKKYLNLRHQMMLEILGGNLEKGKNHYDEIMKHMPVECSVMRIRAIFDFVFHWKLLNITKNNEALSSNFLEQLENEWLNINGSKMQNNKQTGSSSAQGSSFSLVGPVSKEFQQKKIQELNEKIAETPISDPYKCLSATPIFKSDPNKCLSATPTVPTIHLLEKPGNNMDKITCRVGEIHKQAVNEIVENQYKFIKAVLNDDKNAGNDCIRNFKKIGRIEYEAHCNLILGHLNNEPSKIDNAKSLFDDLGYTFGDDKGSYMKQLCELSKHNIDSVGVDG